MCVWIDQKYAGREPGFPALGLCPFTPNPLPVGVSQCTCDLSTREAETEGDLLQALGQSNLQRKFQTSKTCLKIKKQNQRYYTSFLLLLYALPTQPWFQKLSPWLLHCLLPEAILQASDVAHGSPAERALSPPSI